MANLVFTGERIVPGMVPIPVFREHEARYNLATRFTRNRRVVDVACGTGIGTQHLLIAGASECFGIDLDRDAVAYARTQYQDCAFVVCDAQALCLADEVADVVVSFETIEHIRDPLQFVKQCSRVLKPGGLFICSTPNHSVYRWYGTNPFHTQEFSPTEFFDLVGTLFTILETYGQQEILYPTFVMERVVSRCLAWLRLREPIKRVLGGDRVGVNAPTSFHLGKGELGEMVKPYASGWWRRPTYVIAVARKPHRGDRSSHPLAANRELSFGQP